MSLWTGAELRIDGVVTITNGQASYSDYLTEAAQQRVTSRLSKKQVQDGQYIVARCYIGHVPQTSFSWFPPTPPVFYLIECLLKICVGNRVHEWTAETVYSCRKVHCISSAALQQCKIYLRRVKSCLSVRNLWVPHKTRMQGSSISLYPHVI